MTTMHGLYLEDRIYNECHRENNTKHKDRFVLHSLYLNYRAAEAVGEFFCAFDPFYSYIIESDLDISEVKHYVEIDS